MSTAIATPSVLLAGPAAVWSARPSRLLRRGRADLGWAFSRPWGWLGGLAVNLALAAGYLVIAPLTGQTQDWAVLVGSYFVTYLLADVTTTNVLGADADRVRRGLLTGMSLQRILLLKNLTLLLVVGVPVLVVTAVITVDRESAAALALTLPGVLFPVLLWLGIGNVVSVAFPVVTMPVRQRWRCRHDRPSTLRWAVGLALPYPLYYLLQPIQTLPLDLVALLRTVVGQGAATGGVLVIALGLLLHLAGTRLALRTARRRTASLSDILRPTSAARVG